MGCYVFEGCPYAFEDTYCVHKDKPDKCEGVYNFTPEIVEVT